MTKRPPIDEHKLLKLAIIAREGDTTDDGNVAGTTFYDTGLIGAGASSFESMLAVIHPGEDLQVDSKDVVGFDTATGEVTLATAYKGGQITAGTPYILVTFRFVPAEVAALAADVGDASSSTLGSLYAILGDPAQSFVAMVGYEGATALADKLTAARAALIDYIGDPSGHTLKTLTAKWGDINRSLDLILGARWDAGSDLGTDIAAIITALGALVGAAGIFHEQADAAVNITAIAASETDVLHLSVADTRYIVRSLRLKCADPGANTVTVRLYELVNDGLTEVDSFGITTANFGTYHSLMDMFGLPHLAGDELQVTVRASAGVPYAVTGQYSHGKTNV